MRLAPLVLAVTAILTDAGCRRLGATPMDGERQAVTATVQLYFQGHATGDGSYFRRAFHPEAKLYWVKDGALAQKTLAEFAAGASGKPADDEAKRVRSIASIDLAGDSAMVKVELDYPSGAITDYLSLLKVGGTWVIVNKIFHRAKAKVRSPT